MAIKKFILGVLHINPKTNKIKQSILIIESTSEYCAIGEAWAQSKIKFPSQEGWLVQDIITIDLDSGNQFNYRELTEIQEYIEEYEAD